MSDADKTFVDGTNTSSEWRDHGVNLAVWPVGAFEQHGPHLAVSTDGVSAGYVGRRIAIELGAALLPTMPFGTSLEHKGFPGTVSLRPELLMDLVYNMADEMEAQGTTRLIIISGHGGNFSLYPAARWVNRQDRAIKVIVVGPGTPMVSGARSTGMELHAGRTETSAMLAIAPELVRENRVDATPETFEFPFTQEDLNVFGFGRITPKGVWGKATEATAEEGVERVELAVAAKVAWIQERLRLLDENPRYGG